MIYETVRISLQYIGKRKIKAFLSFPKMLVMHITFALYHKIEKGTFLINRNLEIDKLI